MSGPAVLLDDVSKSFFSLKAVDGVTLEVDEGGVLAVAGPPGAGKTTLLRILATILPPDQGRAEVGGFDVVADAPLVRRIIGLSPAVPALDELISGRENVLLVGRLLGLKRKEAVERAEQLLEAFGLTQEGSWVVKSYSFEMRRRLDLAVALVGSPDVVLLDEPTAGFDSTSRSKLWALIDEVAAGGATVVVTTNGLEEANRLATTVAVMDHGRIIAAGTPEDLAASFGEHVIEARPRDPDDGDALRRILQAYAVSGATVYLDGGTMSVPIPNREVFWSAVKKAQTRKVELEHIALRDASLDDIFLTLTGHVADDAGSEPSGEES